MSTKIYSGFKLTINDMEEIHRRINEIRSIVAKKKREGFARLVARMSTIAHDKRTVSGELCDSSPFGVAFDNLLESERKLKTTHRRDPEIDYSMNVVLFLFEGNYYGMLYTEQREFEKLWMDQDFVEYFGYWNNTDPDEDCSEEEWAERERVWETIFEDEWIPSLVGFSYDISLEDIEIVDVEEALEYIPSFDERLVNMTREVAYQRYVEDKEITADNVMKVWREYVDFIKSAEGKDFIDPIREELKEKLTPEITREMLVKY